MSSRIPPHPAPRRRLPLSLSVALVALVLTMLFPFQANADGILTLIDRPQPNTNIVTHHMHRDFASVTCGANYFTSVSVASTLVYNGSDPNWIRFNTFGMLFTIEGYNNRVGTGIFVIASGTTTYFTDGSAANLNMYDGGSFTYTINGGNGVTLPYQAQGAAEIGMYNFPGGNQHNPRSSCSRFDEQQYAPGYSYGAPFYDLSSYAPECYPIYSLYRRGIVNGYGNGAVGPNDTLNRAQMAGVIARANGWQDDDSNGYYCFPDLDGIDFALRKNICTLRAMGIINGYGDGNYYPYDAVLYAQAVSYITRAFVYRGI